MSWKLSKFSNLFEELTFQPGQLGLNLKSEFVPPDMQPRLVVDSVVEGSQSHNRVYRTWILWMIDGELASESKLSDVVSGAFDYVITFIVFEFKIDLYGIYLSMIRLQHFWQI